MSARRYYFGAEKRYNNSGEGQDDQALHDDVPLFPNSSNNTNNNINNNNSKSNTNNDDTNNEPEPDGDKDDDSEFLQEVPYSSSSIDRSSIGSIPWADDAIKKNKLDWERVDRMLSGEEQLPDQEQELRHEIIDWQHKFPSLLTRKAQPLKQQSFDSSHRNNPAPDESGDIDSISDLSLNSLDDFDEGDEEEDDGFLTPTVDRQREQREPTRNYTRPGPNLVAILDRDLHITSVALKLRRREPPAAPAAPSTPQSATVARSRLRMPPILNVLDSNRRFRGLLNNRSFVQLTQVQQQPKSAALTYAERRQQTGIRSAWNMPMAASRFLNNKHAIVLPSLNRHPREFSTNDMTTTTTASNQSISSNRDSLGHGTRRGQQQQQQRDLQQRDQQQRQHQYGLALDQVVTTNSNTPSTGRSISAAIHHPRSEFANSSAFYIPYSASKFKAFK
ncbi:myb-like protein AA [Drosophila grimshawi]|uniref:GH19132 n=1 Tax=Drosophila grimshawi TaxID=7222 RepID=B4JEJ7_DROGR|nr:myb-like protein AA [Drosophila grimshawi]EDV93128.1 GH19132 [Drosophila grimshawi]